MKHLQKYNIFESNNTIIIDTVNDILLDINDLGWWKASSWKKYEGVRSDRDEDIVVLIRIDSIPDQTIFQRSLGQDTRIVEIPSEVTSTIKRLCDYLGDYDTIATIGDDDIGPGGDTGDHVDEVDIENGLLYGGDGKVITKLWFNEFIRIDFTKCLWNRGGYLKKYNEGVISIGKRLHDTLDDILLDIKDDGFRSRSVIGRRFITIEISKDESEKVTFSLKSIEGVVSHISSFLLDEGFDMSEAYTKNYQSYEGEAWKSKFYPTNIDEYKKELKYQSFVYSIRLSFSRRSSETDIYFSRKNI